MKRKGLSVWLFSKVVMFIFLFLTFASVISFMKIVSDRTAADAAEVLAMQVTEAVQTSLLTPSLSSKMIVPIPRTLPEMASVGSRARFYTLHIFASGGKLSAAIGWGADPRSYAAASSVQLGDISFKNSVPLEAFSDSYPYIVIFKSGQFLCVQGCKEINPEEECTPAITETSTGGLLCTGTTETNTGGTGRGRPTGGGSTPT